MEHRRGREEFDRARFVLVGLSAADKRHLRRHDVQEHRVGVERPCRHEHQRICNVLHVHARLDHGVAARLLDTGGHAFGHLGRGVADVDLTAGDVIGAAVE